jgi:hypothetical protein
MKVSPAGIRPSRWSGGPKVTVCHCFLFLIYPHRYSGRKVLRSNSETIFLVSAGLFPYLTTTFQLQRTKWKYNYSWNESLNVVPFQAIHSYSGVAVSITVMQRHYFGCKCWKTLIPWSRTLLERSPVVQPLKKFLAFHGTQRFITVITWPSTGTYSKPIQPTPFHSISPKSVLILSFHLHLDLPSDLFPSGFLTNNVYTLSYSSSSSSSSSSHSYYILCPSPPPRLAHSN